MATVGQHPTTPRLPLSSRSPASETSTFYSFLGIFLMELITNWYSSSGRQSFKVAQNIQSCLAPAGL